MCLNICVWTYLHHKSVKVLQFQLWVYIILANELSTKSDKRSLRIPHNRWHSEFTFKDPLTWWFVGTTCKYKKGFVGRNCHKLYKNNLFSAFILQITKRIYIFSDPTRFSNNSWNFWMVVPFIWFEIKFNYQLDAIFVYFSSTCFGLLRPSSGAIEPARTLLKTDT